MLHVSTTPVKEAFRSLQAEGLIYTPAATRLIRIRDIN
ncbi:MAG: hypothetical protein ACLVD8_27235 [Enterocloster sp.]